MCSIPSQATILFWVHIAMFNQANARFFCLFILFALPFLYNTEHFGSPGELPKLMGAAYLICAMASLAVLTRFKKTSIELRWSVSLSLMGLTVLSSVLSYLFSVDMYLSFWGLKELPSGSLLSVLLFFSLSIAVVQSIKNLSDIKKYSVALLILLVVQVIIGVFQIFGIHLFNIVQQKAVSGTLGLTVFYATFLGALSPLLIEAYLFAHKKRFAAFFGFLIFLLGQCLFHTASRAPVVSYFFVTALFCIYFAVISKNSRSVKKIIYLIMIQLISISFFKYTSAALELEKKLQTPLVSKAIESRMLVWKVGLQAWEQRPLIGFGPETFISAQNPLLPAELNKYEYWSTGWAKAHNHLIDTLVNTGIVGLLVQLLILVWMTYVCAKFVFFKKQNIEQTSAVVFYLGYLFLFIANLTCFNSVSTQALAFVFPVLFYACLENSTPLFSFNIPRRLNVLTSILVLVVIALVASEFYSYSKADILNQQARFQHEKTQNFGKALELGTESLIYDDKEPATYCRIASILSQVLRNNYVISTTKISTSIKSLPEESQREFLKKTEEMLAGCIEHGKNQTKFYLWRANILGNLFQGRYIEATKALEGFRDAEKISPNNPDIYRGEGVVFLKANETDKFTAAMKKAIALKADYIPAYLELVMFEYSNKNPNGVHALAEEIKNIHFYSDEFLPYLNDLIEHAKENHDPIGERIFTEILKNKVAWHSDALNKNPDLLKPQF